MAEKVPAKPVLGTGFLPLGFDETDFGFQPQPGQ